MFLTENTNLEMKFDEMEFLKNYAGNDRILQLIKLFLDSFRESQLLLAIIEFLVFKKLYTIN